MDGVQFSTKNNCAVIVRFWPKPPIRGSAAMRQLSEQNPTFGRQGQHHRHGREAAMRSPQ